MILNHNGQSYEITNWTEFSNKVLFLLGQQLVNAVQDEAMKMKLWDSGRFIRSIDVNYGDGSLVLISDAPYAPYLEYGTLEFGAAFSESEYPEPMIPKKKDLPRALAEQFPRGMQPFAPFRKVLYNQKKMDKAIRGAFA